MATRGTDFVQSFDRGLSVIRVFRSDRSRLTLNEVAKEAGLTPAAARRFLLTLVELGFVAREGREFVLLPRVLELGYASLSGSSPASLIRPAVEELVATIEESAAVSVLVGAEIVSIVRVPTRRMMTVALQPGSRLPAYCTSAGRVLLAGLTEAGLAAYFGEVVLEARTNRTVVDEAALRSELATIAEAGYAVVDQEMEDGLITLGVPVRDAAGTVVAALNISVDAFRADRRLLVGTLLEPLRATAEQIELVVRSIAPAGIAAHRLLGQP